MKGDLDAALSSLSDAYGIAPNDRTVDRTVLGLLRAELLHLDLQHTASLAVFTEFVAPLAGRLAAEQQFAVEQNRNDIRFAQWAPDSSDEFYNLVDQKRLLNFDWLDYRDLFEAKQAADRGKHYAALPVLWQQLRRAYDSGCWRPGRWAHQLFAAECVALRLWEDALHHALVSGDEALIPTIAEGILSARDAGLLARIVSRLRTTANLRSHFVVACKVLVAIADAIPDGELPPLAAWLLPRAAEVQDYPYGPHPVVTAWGVVKAVGERLTGEDAQRFVSTATAHPIWTTKLDDPNRIVIGREEMVEALVHLAYAVPPSKAEGIASAALPLITERPQIDDYADVVNLLCHLADRGGDRVRSLVAAALYPPGKPVHPLLVQVAGVFGTNDAFDAERMNRFARHLAGQIRLQVQRVGKGETAQQPDERMFETFSPIPEGTLHVFTAPLMNIHSTAKHRAKLGASELAEVVRAILDLARDRDNLCSNRASLVHALAGFEDAMPSELRAEVVRAVEPLARGEVEESSAYSTAADANNPLNPFKRDTGSPEDVQSAALVTLAAFGRHDRAAMRRLGELLEETLCDQRPEIRRAAYAAVRQLPDVTDGILLGLLAGLRDPDPNAGVSAFAALASQTGWTLTRNHWRLFLLSARTASQSSNVKLRRHVAGALRAWVVRCPHAFHDDLHNLLASLATDISSAVREAARIDPE